MFFCKKFLFKLFQLLKFYINKYIIKYTYFYDILFDEISGRKGNVLTTRKNKQKQAEEVGLEVVDRKKL